MEERITVKKDSIIPQVFLNGLEASGFSLIKKTSTTHPIYLFFSKTSDLIAIYDEGPFRDDELIVLNTKRPGKIKVLIREYRNKKSFEIEDQRFIEIANELEKLISTNNQKNIDELSFPENS